MIEGIGQDLTVAARSFRKRPSFFLVAAATLAIGIGATTTIFSVIDGVLFSPLPYADADRIVRVGLGSPESDRVYSLSYLDFKDLQRDNTTFDALAATRTLRVTIQGDAGPEVMIGTMASPEFFPAMGVQPILGRAYTRDEDDAERRVVVLSHGLWQRRWGGDRAIVGRNVTLNAEPFTVLGVLPESFRPPEGLGQGSSQLWIPLTHANAETRASRGDGFLTGVGRLREGVAADVAGADLEALGERIRASFPEESGDHHFAVASLHGQTVGTVGNTLTPLFGAVAFLLLIACANVANLMLIRSSERGREFALRAAIGASRRRLGRQMLTESLLLGLVGGVGGVLIAWLGVDAFVRFNPGDIPRITEVGVDGRVLGFALLAAVGTSVLFGLAPVIAAGNVQAVAELKAGGRAGGVSRRLARIRAGLVVGETALALLLVIGAGLLIHSFARMTQVDPGFESEGVYSITVGYPDATSDAELTTFFDELLDRVAALPGVEEAGATAILPISGGYMYQSLAFDGQPTADDDRFPVRYQEVSADYFATMQISVEAGRGIRASDDGSAPLIAVINERMAREAFGDADPIGRTFTLGENGLRDGVFEIVGVVEDVRQLSLLEPAVPELYFSYAQLPRPQMSVVARTRTADASIVTAMRGELSGLRSDVPALRPVSMAQYVRGSLAGARFYAWVLGGCATVALSLALVGIYGALAFVVAQQSHEMGVRMALGASRESVLGRVFKQGLQLAASGLAIGLLLATPLTRGLQSFVFEITPTDPVTLIGASVAVMLTASLACLIPARRATQLDPVDVLKNE